MTQNPDFYYDPILGLQYSFKDIPMFDFCWESYFPAHKIIEFFSKTGLILRNKNL